MEEVKQTVEMTAEENSSLKNLRLHRRLKTQRNRLSVIVRLIVTWWMKQLNAPFRRWSA